MSATDTDELTLEDLSDLESLDDDHTHAYCPKCCPDIAPGVPFTAVCGRRVVDFGPVITEGPIPDDVCPECFRVAVRGVCPNGHRRSH